MSDTNRDLPSGRFLLRIEPELHARLRETAERCGVSLNELCSRKLAQPGPDAPEPAGAAVDRAVGAVGDALTGVIAFGSWAREEMASSSDVDLLVIVDDGVPIRRKLYQAWDASPLFWQGHRIEPHFVHLPDLDPNVAGLWAEAAVDGIILFDPGLRVSARLVEVRRKIVAGRLVRRECHGHPDYIARARIRLDALDLFFDGESWADVVRESQEVVELSLKAVRPHVG